MEAGSVTRQPRKIIRRTTEQIESLINDYESSGLSANDFCKLHQIKKVYLTRWIKRYRKNKAPKGFVAVRASSQRVDRKEVLFAEYQGIRFYQPVEAAYFKALLS